MGEPPHLEYVKSLCKSLGEIRNHTENTIFDPLYFNHHNSSTIENLVADTTWDLCILEIMLGGGIVKDFERAKTAKKVGFVWGSATRK